MTKMVSSNYFAKSTQFHSFALTNRNIGALPEAAFTERMPTESYRVTRVTNRAICKNRISAAQMDASFKLWIEDAQERAPQELLLRQYR